MKTHILILSLAIGAALTFSSNALACPCKPCKCSPCNCGGGGKSGKHHDHHDHGSSFGVGGTVDFGGIGHRDPEGNPFAAGGDSTNRPHTQEKPKPKTAKNETPVSNPFTNCQLTGDKAKQVAAADGNSTRAPQNP
jgi:hypothetical protein